MTGKRVLIVEDDPIARSDAAALLEEAGLEVVEMDNADDALTYAMEQAQDLAAIFTDVRLPGDTNGVELVEMLARQMPNVVLLVTSGLTWPAGKLPDNVRFLPKPWKGADVLAALREATEEPRPASAPNPPGDGQAPG